MDNNLENIKIGDKIIYMAGSFHPKQVLANVIRVTAQQITDSRNNRFWKKDGRMVGDAYTLCHCATEQEIAEIKRRDARDDKERAIYNFFRGHPDMSFIADKDLDIIVNIITK